MISRFNGEVLSKIRSYNNLIPHRMKSYRDELVENEDGTLRLVRIPLESCEAVVYRKTDQKFNVKCNHTRIMNFITKKVRRSIKQGKINREIIQYQSHNKNYYQRWKARTLTSNFLFHKKYPLKLPH